MTAATDILQNVANAADALANRRVANAPIDWKNPPPPISGDRRVRLAQILEEMAFNCHNPIYDRMHKGIFPPGYKDGNTTFWWRSHLDLYNQSLPMIGSK